MTLQNTSGETNIELDNSKDDIDKQEKIEYDDLLSSAGELGRYQLFLFFTTFPFYVYGVFVYYSQLFMTEVSPNHWCWIPELGNLTVIERRNIAIPRDVNSVYGYSQCTMYSANWSDVLLTGRLPESNWSTVPCQFGWEFNKSEIPYPTISSELGWVCDKSSYQADAQAIFFVGSITGGLIIGWVADRFGRLPAIVISNLLGCVGGFASTFARNFAEFAASRFFVGMAYDNCMMMAYLIVLEYVAPKYRTLIANMTFSTFYSISVTILPWIAFACGHWKIFSLATSIPLGLALLAPFIIPESPRWFLSKGRTDDAINKILTIGRVNRKQISPKLIEKFKRTSLQIKQEESQSFLEIFKKPVMRKIFILICLEYMCCTIVFDGLVRSIGQLEFDFFVSFSVISFTEFPSVMLLAFIMDWIGRKWLTIVVMSIGCIFSILSITRSGIPTVIFAVIARFAVNMSYSTAMQWAAELLPTPVRGSGTSFVHICGYFSTILAPYIVYLKIYVYWLPLILIGCIAALGALIAFGIPETAKKDLPHTFDDAENLAKNQRLWTIPYLEQKKKINEGQVNNGFNLEN